MDIIRNQPKWTYFSSHAGDKKEAQQADETQKKLTHKTSSLD